MARIVDDSAGERGRPTNQRIVKAISRFLSVENQNSKYFLSCVEAKVLDVDLTRNRLLVEFDIAYKTKVTRWIPLVGIHLVSSR